MTLSEIRVACLCRVLMTMAIALAPMTAGAFDTLNGDRTNWSGTPDYSIGRLSPNIANQAQIAAIQAAFNAWSDVA